VERPTSGVLSARAGKKGRTWKATTGSGEITHGKRDSPQPAQSELARTLLEIARTAMARQSSATDDIRKTVAARRRESPVRVDISALTHPGHVRANNEDHFLVSKATRVLETMATSLPAGEVPERADEVNYVMVVADGMGGHAAGEVASRMAINALVSLALQIPDWIFWVDAERAPEVERRAREAVQQVGSMLIERGRQDAALAGMGSTLTAARSCGGPAVWNVSRPITRTRRCS
jgi:hypothetical protein